MTGWLIFGAYCAIGVGVGREAVRRCLDAVERDSYSLFSTANGHRPEWVSIASVSIFVACIWPAAFVVAVLIALIVDPIRNQWTDRRAEAERQKADRRSGGAS